MMKEVFGTLSVVFSCSGFAPYFWDIYKKRTKPHALTWIVWVLLDGIIFAAQYSDHAGAGAWFAGFGAIACLGVAICALVQGEKNIRKSDVAAFVAALSIIPLWCFTSNALLAVILASMIDALGFYPTFRKSYAKPHQETLLLYGLDGSGGLFALLAMEKFSLINVLHPMTVVVLEAAFVCMALGRRRILQVSL
ncbi:MAG: hypothetical protein P4M13_09215 [Alphaproteobacteria bacterium]|nr:hypothetical protein [Alphaproteobacteria bacterium]